MIKLVWLIILVIGTVYVLSLYTGTSFKDWFSPSRWKSVLIFLLKKALHKLGDKPGFLSDDEILQYAFRVLACPKCLKNGDCLSCGCNAIGKMNVREDSCSAGRWGPFKTLQEWNEYRTKYNVEFKLFINGKNIDEIET